MDPLISSPVKPQEASPQECPKPHKPFLVTVEGNIGSGKSTMLNYFNKMEDVELCPEPVNQWCDLDGHNLLGKLYEDPNRWSFQFQSYVQLTRLQILRKKTDAKVKIVERSIQNNKYCFLELARKEGSLSSQELEVLNAWYDMLDKTMDLKLDLIVYLRTSPEVAYQRMRSRNRAEESGAPFSYLQHLHEAYEDWLIRQKFGDHKVPILVLDADQDLESMVKTYMKYADYIKGSTGAQGNIYHAPKWKEGDLLE